MVTAARLLSTIEPMPHPARVEALAGAARAATPTELDALLADLLARGPWERLISLRIATVAGHREHVGRCLDVDEPGLVRRAVRPAVRLGVAGSLVERIAELPAVTRGDLAAAARAEGDRDLADAMLAPLRSHGGDREAAALLAGCSTEVAAEQLPDLAHAMGSWTTFARRHPEVFLDHVDSELDAAPPAAWPALLSRFASGLAALAPTSPTRVLDVLERTEGHLVLGGALGRALPGLARHDPSRVLAVVLSPRRPGPVPTGRRLWRALAVLPDDDLVRLAHVLTSPELIRLLGVLPPARRPAVYLPVLGARDLVETRVPVEVLDEVPWPTRHAEAARLLTLRSATTDPATSLRLTARLPWEQSEAALRAAVGRPLAEDRAEGYQLLVLAAAGSRDAGVVEGVLASLTRLPNEQDPVRSAALRSLARVSPRLLTDDAADLAALQVRAAVQARDASRPTLAAARALAQQLLREGVESARPRLLAAGMQCLEDAGGHVDHPHLAGLAGSLPRAADPVLRDALLPRIRSDSRVGRYSVLLDLVRSLGRRAWTMPDLQDLLADACRASDDGVVHRAVGLWLAPPATRDDRVAVLLRRDPSTIAIAAVAQVVGGRRTDLLDGVLDGRQRGRFATRGVRLVPFFARSAARWTPRQVDRYRTVLGSIVDDTEVSSWRRSSAIAELGRVPGSAAQLRRLVDHPLPQLADAALAALAWTDDPAAALPALLAHTDGDRAHVAVSAATRAARFVPPRDLVSPLEAVLRHAKVTARKEACRLLAEHHTPGAAAVLADELSRPGQHRDVRRAIVSSLRFLLDDPVAWGSLESSVGDDDVAGALLEISPDWMARRHRSRYALLVAGLADRDVDEVAVPALTALASWVQWDATDLATAVAARHATDLDRAAASTWRPGVDVLVTAAAHGDDTTFSTALHDLLRAHRDRDLGPELNAAAGRDLPARQRVERCALGIAAAVRADGPDGAGVSDTARTAARAIAAAPLLVDVAISPAVEALPWSRPDDAAAALLEIAAWCEQPTATEVAVSLLHRAAASRLPLLPSETVPHLVEVLSGDGSRAAGRLGVALLAAAGRSSGWPHRHRALLRAQRGHGDPDVRLAAARVVANVE